MPNIKEKKFPAKQGTFFLIRGGGLAAIIYLRSKWPIHAKRVQVGGGAPTPFLSYFFKSRGNREAVRWFEVCKTSKVPERERVYSFRFYEKNQK